MNYKEQLIAEQENKKIFEYITNNISAEEFNDYYFNHTREETRQKYNIKNDKQLLKILKVFNYDFSKKKPSSAKGKPSTRSKESYIAGGQKSAKTQKQHWENKTDEEKIEWSEKMQVAHSSEEFKANISQINKDYWNNLSEDEKKILREKKSKSAKNTWASLTDEEQKAIMANRFKNGRTYNCKNTKPNQAFADLLDTYNIKYSREFCLDRHCFDFKIDNCLIEIDPTITHNVNWSPFGDHVGIDKYYHRFKSSVAEKYGYRCIHIFDWENPEQIIKSFFCRENKKIYARQCQIHEVPIEITKQFINEYHIQGYANSTINIGLFYAGELVSIMTFGKPRYNQNYEYELIRYCAKYNVCGGAEKLFKYFINSYSPTSIISYCDKSKFTGETYNKLSFKLKSNNTLGVHWAHPNTKQHITDNLLRQQGFDRLFCTNYGKGTNNKELMIKAGFMQVYDCGQAVYAWKPSTN